MTDQKLCRKLADNLFCLIVVVGQAHKYILAVNYEYRVVELVHLCWNVILESCLLVLDTSLECRLDLLCSTLVLSLEAVDLVSGSARS